MAEANKELAHPSHQAPVESTCISSRIRFLLGSEENIYIVAAKETTLDAAVATVDGLFQMRKERTAELKDSEGVEDASALLSAVFDESLAK